MLYSSRTCLAPFEVWSWRMARITCSTFTCCECCSRASSTESFNILPACSSRAGATTASSEGVFAQFLMRLSISVLTLFQSVFICIISLKRGHVLSLIIPRSRCSGFTLILSRRTASSRLNERSSETFGENWFVICCFFVIFILL